MARKSKVPVYVAYGVGGAAVIGVIWWLLERNANAQSAPQVAPAPYQGSLVQAPTVQPLTTNSNGQTVSSPSAQTLLDDGSVTSDMPQAGDDIAPGVDN